MPSPFGCKKRQFVHPLREKEQSLACSALLFRFEFVELFLELSDLGDQVREAPQGGLLAEALAVGQGGHPADDHLRIDIFVDRAACGGHGAVAKLDVIADGGLTA